MKNSELRERTKKFVFKVIAVCDTIDARRSRLTLIDQLVRSATSIGANIHEANYASSKADFSNKLQIALKECYETEYWLEIFSEIKAVSDSLIEELMQECGVIRRMLVKSINTVKEDKQSP